MKFCTPWNRPCNIAKAARKGTGHPTSHADGSGYVSTLKSTPPTYKSIWDYLYFFEVVCHFCKFLHVWKKLMYARFSPLHC